MRVALLLAFLVAGAHGAVGAGLLGTPTLVVQVGGVVGAWWLPETYAAVPPVVASESGRLHLVGSGWGTTVHAPDGAVYRGVAAFGDLHVDDVAFVPGVWVVRDPLDLAVGAFVVDGPSSPAAPGIARAGVPAPVPDRAAQVGIAGGEGTECQKIDAPDQGAGAVRLSVPWSAPPREGLAWEIELLAAGDDGLAATTTRAASGSGTVTLDVAWSPGVHHVEIRMRMLHGGGIAQEVRCPDLVTVR